MLPAVTDVVRELARTVAADPAVLFKAARAVVADELARVKQGFESAPLDVLVKRARRQLEAEGVAAPVEPEPPKSVSLPVSEPAKPPRPERKAASDEPFPGAAGPDLEWEKDLPINADDAPFRSAILPLPPKSRIPQGIFSPDVPPAPPVPKEELRARAPEPSPAPPPATRLPVPERVNAPEGLAVERSGSAPLPKPIDDLPLFSSSSSDVSPVLEPMLQPPPPPPPPAPELGMESPFEPEASRRTVPEHPRFEPPPPEEPPPAKPRSPWVEPPVSRVEPPAPRTDRPVSRVEPPAPRAERPVSRVEPPPRVEEPPFVEPPVYDEEPPPRPEPAAVSMSEMPPLSRLVGESTEPVEPAMQEFAFKGREEAAPSRPPKKSGGRTGWIVAILVVLAVAAGLAWAVKTFLSGGLVKSVEAPAPAAKKRPEPAPPLAAITPPAALAPAKPAPKETPPPKAAAPAAPVAKGKAALLVTPDWTGKPVIYVVHFSSSKDRPSAEKEAKRLAAELGKPARAVEVDLGDKGTWYRAVVGEFATVDEARAYRADLEAKKTPGLGFVYEMRGR
jgi:hypothetical protein